MNKITLDDGGNDYLVATRIENITTLAPSSPDCWVVERFSRIKVKSLMFGSQKQLVEWDGQEQIYFVVDEVKTAYQKKDYSSGRRRFKSIFIS